MTDATLTAAEGAGTTALDAGVIGLPRSLFLYENRGIEALVVHSTTTGRALYLYENRGLQAIAVLARALYLYEARGIEALVVLTRDLYLIEATRDTEVFPWLMRLSPNEQLRGGQVDLYGDGLGSIVDVAAGSTVTASSTNGVNVPGNAISRTVAAWVSNDTAAAWLRLTFASAQVITALALEAGGNGWGVPLFRFSDGGADVVGGVGVPSALAPVVTEYPVGATRALYTLPAPRTCTWLEVRVSSGAPGSLAGLSEVWAYADQDTAAETSTVLLGIANMGIVGWMNRSPGLHPANGGVPITAAATVTIPADGESGLVTVREAT